MSPNAADAAPAGGIDPGVVLDALAELRRDMKEVLDYARGRSKTLLTIEEVAEQVGRAPYTVRSWIRSGRLKATRVDGTGPRGRLLVHRESMEALIKGAGVGGASR